MKKFLVLLLAFVLCMTACMCSAEEQILINKIKYPENDFTFPEGTQLLEVYFPKIFGCDAALIRYGEYSMLLDCAGNQWREVEKLLNKVGVTELTYAFNSHPDADHIGGFNHILKNVPAKEFLLAFPEDYPEGDNVRFKVYEDLHAQGIPFHPVKDGDTVEFGDAKLTVYQLWREELPRTNNRSAMLKVEFGERSMLFTGDVQQAAQLIYVDEQPDIQADVMKFPHHGYDRINAGFIALVNPILVISTSNRVDAERSYQQMRDMGLPDYFTERGIIRLATDGKVWMVERLK